MARKLTDAVLGFIVGDALGVPVEFKTRAELDKNPVIDMRGFGTYNQPPGTWSDDSSMTLATIDALNETKWKASPALALDAFQRWYRQGDYTPYGQVFDIGNTTARALNQNRGQGLELDNGNGALMRMLPLAFLPTSIKRKLKWAKEYAALTHSNMLNLLGCKLFVEVVDNLIHGVDDWLGSACSLLTFGGDPTRAFDRIPRVGELTRDEIKSTGYVVDTLEAALWCFMTTDNYRDAVLTAVNLGGDTDTIAAITGGLAGVAYGESAIPREWLAQIPRLDIIRRMLGKAETHIHR